MMELLFVLSLCVIFTLRTSGEVWIQPEQVHLSYGVEPTEMVVTWLTQSQVNESSVEYGQTGFTQSVKGTITKFVNPNYPKTNSTPHHTSYVHRAVMTGLAPGKKYMYHVGGLSGWSELFTFIAKHTDPDWQPRIAIYGDMGNTQAMAISYIQREAQLRSIHAIIHIGDFAYDMIDDDGYRGDAFLRQIQPIGAYIPYMTCPGNHEWQADFTHYRHRFSMPGDDGNMWFTFTMGKALFISINTEVYMTKDEGLPESMIAEQYLWLQKTLEEANKPSNRAAYPWIIVVGHRPMYCSNDDTGSKPPHCTQPYSNPITVGINNVTRQYSLEDLFYKAGVDLQFYAHEHSYERLFPVYRFTVCNGTGDNPYHNPRAPVHIISGSAGDSEGQTKFKHILYPWSGPHSDDYGYTRITVYNDTHLYLDQTSSDKGGVPIDSMWLIKDKHGAGSYNCHLKNLQPVSWKYAG